MKTKVHKESYDKSFEQFEQDFIREHEAFYRNPAAYWSEPFGIAGNLYYVGDKMVCIHLIDTGEGLLLIDSGYQHTIHLLFHSIWLLGFSPRDVRWILHTHGHFDHFGATNEFRALFGTKSYLSEADALMLQRDPRLGLLCYNPNPYACLPEVDETFRDGDVLSFGSLRVRCIATPGHTPGVMTFLFDIPGTGSVPLRAGLFGGTGVLTMYRAFLKRYDQPEGCRQDFLHSLEKVRGERVDVVLGNHPGQNRTIEKRRCMLSGEQNNPFIAPAEWEHFLAENKQNFQHFLFHDR